MNRTVRSLVAAGCGLALLGFAPQSAAAGRSQTAVKACSAPAGNAFYTPPRPLPAGRHGSVIRCRRVASPVPGALAWQVLYLSASVSGAGMAVSGTVLVPTAARPGVRPVVAYASGTQGWGDQCAPSREMAGGTFDEQFAVNNLLAQGWAVAVTDYPGLGTPGGEQYSVGVAEGHAVLDVLTAATQLPGAGLRPRAPMGIEGYPGRWRGRLGGPAGGPVRAGPAAARRGDGRHAGQPAGGRRQH